MPWNLWNPSFLDLRDLAPRAAVRFQHVFSPCSIDSMKRFLSNVEAHSSESFQLVRLEGNISIDAIANYTRFLTKIWDIPKSCALSACIYFEWSVWTVSELIINTVFDNGKILLKGESKTNMAYGPTRNKNKQAAPKTRLNKTTLIQNKRKRKQ